jgi:hypothetical protein
MNLVWEMGEEKQKEGKMAVSSNGHTKNRHGKQT